MSNDKVHECYKNPDFQDYLISFDFEDNKWKHYDVTEDVWLCIKCCPYCGKRLQE